MTSKLIIFHQHDVLLNINTIFWDESSFLKLKLESIRMIQDHDMTWIEVASKALHQGWMRAKSVLLHIPQEEFDALAKGIVCITWDKNHQFCGRCGQKTTRIWPHYELKCQSCEQSYYPRISPAVVVLIRREDKILMARSPHFDPGVYALIAGFVEGGETLESAVHREVFEEVGIRIQNLSYYGSQPWPFPDALMVGFIAEYLSGEIQVNTQELESAGWYAYDALPGLPAWSMSITSNMIQTFLDQHAV